jgi:hypothetical protein
MRDTYSQQEQRRQYNLALERHDGNRWAIKNHLMKHYGYNQDDAWAIYEQFSGVDLDKADDTKAECEPNYIVGDLGDTGVFFAGEIAKTFVKMADELRIPRDSYRLYVQVRT